MPINSNDLIFGDDSGVIVLLDNEGYKELWTAAKKIKVIEENATKKIKDGARLNKILNLEEYYNHIYANKPSSLKWLI